MAFNGWAALLNGVIISGGCEHGQVEWDLSGCASEEEGEERTVVDRLTDPPDGLGLPSRRTQDTTFAGRDGVKMYNDYYDRRVITLRATVGPHTCSKCGDVRRQVRAITDAWKRNCENCVDELVIFTPCTDEVYDEFPTAQLKSQRTNLMAYNARGQAYTVNCSTFEFTQNRAFAGATGTYTIFEEPSDLPANLPDEQLIARKTWTSDVTSFCRDYPRCYDGGVGTDSMCYDNAISGNNDASGFIMGCIGQDAYPVTADSVYAMSGYMRSNVAGINLLVRVWFYDGDGAIVGSEEGAISTTTADEWIRVSHAAVVPAGAETMMFALDTASGGPAFEAGNTLDLTAVLVERFVLADISATPPFDQATVDSLVGDYFDGDFDDSDNPVLGGQKIDYSFEGDSWASPSLLEVYTYVPGPDRALNGPFGITGRGREAQVRWRRTRKQMADILLRFDALDHRINILDVCGTPWTYDCVEIEAGSESKTWCYGEDGTRCYGTDGTRCYDNDVKAAVPATEVAVLGTENTFPTITLQGPLTRPTIQNLTTEQFLYYDAVIEDGADPVVIYTEDMQAFQGTVNVSHLLSGAVDFQFSPGTQELRMLSRAVTDTGTAQICWRPAVVQA